MSEMLLQNCMSCDQISKVIGDECDITLLRSIDSTNEWVRQEIRSRRTFPFVCFAEEQTQGRGRRGKTWVSPSNSNIYMSLAWKLDVSLNEIGPLSIVMGLAVIRTLGAVGIKQARLKWPNDVLVDGKKIAGILIETEKSIDGDLVAIIGIGLNFDWSGDGKQTPDQSWTDVVSLIDVRPAQASGYDRASGCSRDFLAGLLLKECMEMCELYPHNNESLLMEYRASYDDCLHKQVDVILDSGQKLSGIAKGVTSYGEIRVLINGEERLFNSADISLRNEAKGY
jgi:BirA family biotin operon repressor/biotin-[acetyl-CoA-carboxylase] ligase